MQSILISFEFILIFLKANLVWSWAGEDNTITIYRLCLLGQYEKRPMK